jgi:PAS domain S-box-containing protein
MNRHFRFKLAGLFVFIIASLVWLVVVSFKNYERFADAQYWVTHTHEVISESEKIISVIKDFESGNRGYVITRDSSFLEFNMEARPVLDSHIDLLKGLTRDNPVQQVRIDSLIKLVEKRIAVSQQAALLSSQGNGEAARQLIAKGQGRILMNQIRELISEIQEDEQQLLLHRQQANIKSERNFRITLGAVAVVMMLVTVVAFLLISNHLIYKQKAEDELFVKSELYSQTLASLGDGVISTDVNGVITFINRAAAKLTGWSQQEVIGKHIDFVFHITNERTGLTVINPLMAALKENKIVLLGNHTILHRKDGTTLFIDDSGAPIHNRDGEVIGGVLVFRDISDKKLAEDALKESNDKFKAFFENSMVGILHTAPDGRILNANPAACRLLDQTEEEIIKAGRQGIVDEADERVKLFLDERRRRGRAVGEMTMVRRDGSKFPAEVSSAIFLDKEGKEKTCLIFSDITDRKLSEGKMKELNLWLEQQVEMKTREVIEKEHRYRYALDHMMEGVQIIDYNWRNLYLNDEVIRQSKHTREHLFERTLMELYPGIENTSLFKSYRECMELRVNRNIETEFEFPDGSKGWFELRAQPVPEGIFILSMDITARKTAELKLQMQFKELQKINAELDRFVYSVSHDLRAPLASLLGLISILEIEIGKENGKQLSRLEMMKKSVTKLDVFISEILDYSRNARQEVARDKIDFKKLLAEVEDNLSYMEWHRFAWNIDIRQDREFISDKGRVSIILSNLLSNAIKYSDPSKTEAQINVRINTHNGGATIEVEDNGIGIHEKDKERIFGMFERASAQAPGSGLGLYIVKETLSKLKGTIEIQSELTRGTRFTVTIPNLNSGNHETI